MNSQLQRNNKFSTILSNNTYEDIIRNSRNSSHSRSLNSRQSRRSKSPLEVQSYQLQRQAYGPIVSVFHNGQNSYSSNDREARRNRRNLQKQLPIDSQDELIQNIFMLSLQNQRLSLIIQTLQRQNNSTNLGFYQNNYHQTINKLQQYKEKNRNCQFQNDRLKQQVISLQFKLQNIEKTQIGKDIQNHKSRDVLIQKQNQWKQQKNTFINQISQLKILNQYLKKKSVGLEDRVQQVIRQKKHFEQKAQRSHMQASNLRKSSIFNMSGDMSKSFIKEKANQISLWKQKANKFESLLSQQKFYINSLQDQNNRAKKKQEQQNIRLQQLLQRKRQPQKISRGTVTQDKQLLFSFNSNGRTQQVSELKRQVERKSQELIYKSRQINQLNQKIKSLQNQLKSQSKSQEKAKVKSNKNSVQQLQQKLNNLIRSKEKLQKMLQKERQQHQIQLTMLKNSINQLKATLRDKQHQIQRKDSQLEIMLRKRKGGSNNWKLDSSNKQQISVIKINKSISSSNIGRNRNPGSYTIELEAIFDGVKQVQTSNERMGRLINSRSVSYFRPTPQKPKAVHINQNHNEQNVRFNDKLTREVNNIYYANQTFYAKN